MEIEYLRQIVCLSKTLNFGQAAKQLFIAQPTLSKHVKTVEASLGTQLFNRNGRSVNLTEEGRLFVADAENVIQSYDEAINKLKSRLSNDTQYITLGYSDILPEEWKNEIKEKISKTCSHFEIKTRIYNPSRIIEMLLADQIGLAVVPFLNGMYISPALHAYKFPDSALELVCPNDHPLSKLEKVCVADFENEQMLIPDNDIHFGEPIGRYFKKHGFQINEESHFISFYEASAMVSMKRGLALLPRYARGLSYMNVTFVPIEDLEWFVEPTMLWKKHSDKHLINQISPSFITV